jgi:hypothetical protein
MIFSSCYSPHPTYSARADFQQRQNYGSINFKRAMDNGSGMTIDLFIAISEEEFCEVFQNGSGKGD